MTGYVACVSFPRAQAGLFNTSHASARRGGCQLSMYRQESTLQRPEVTDDHFRRRPARVNRHQPLRIAVAPTIRLSEGVPRRVPQAGWAEPGTVLIMPHVVRLKRRSGHPRLRRRLRRTGVAPVVLGHGDVVPHPFACRRHSFSQRTRDRALALFLFATMGVLLSLVTPLGIFPSALTLAIAWAELNVGWTRLSRAATTRRTPATTVC